MTASSNTPINNYLDSSLEISMQSTQKQKLMTNRVALGTLIIIYEFL